MSLPEQAGKVVDALKTSPGLLTIVVLQLITLWVIFSVSKVNAEHRQQREMYMLERCIAGSGSGNGR